MFSNGHEPNCTRFGEDIVLLSMLTKFQKFQDILLCFETLAAQRRVASSDQGHKSHFLTPVKIKGGMGEMPH